MPTTAADTLALVHSQRSHLATTLSLLDRPSPASTQNPSSPPLRDIRSDLEHLVQDASKHLTAISLALKPPISLDAVHGSLLKLEPTLAKLRFALEQLPSPVGPSSSLSAANEPTVASRLARKIRWSAREALEALSTHLTCTAALLSLPPSSSSSTSADVQAHKAKRDAVLVATKSVWAAVERFEALPRTELDAERAAWKEAMGLLDDCAEEVKALAARDVKPERSEKDQDAQAEEEEEEEEDEEEEDEDEEPLTATERSRAVLAAQLVRLARLLLAHLYQRTNPASTPPPAACLPAWTHPTLLQQAATHASTLSAAGDELAGAMEPGQERDEVEEAVEALCEAAEGLAGAMERALVEREDEHEGEGEGASPGDDNGEEGDGEPAQGADVQVDADTRSKEREWLAMWRRQRDSVRDKLVAL